MRRRTIRKLSHQAVRAERKLHGAAHSIPRSINKNKSIWMERRFLPRAKAAVCVCSRNGVRADSRRDFSFRAAKAVAAALNSI